MRIRKAIPTDAKGIARVHVDSWKTTYEKIVPSEFLRTLSYVKREELWRNNISNGGVYVAETEEKNIVGFSTGGKKRTSDYPGYTGELYAIYLLKEYQRGGVGKRLVRPIIEEIRQQNISAMIVKVLEGNRSYLFYEALGGRKIDIVEDQISGKTLNEYVYGWNDLTVLERLISKD